ncbi:MAG: tRNA (adenosine(37)-N6)-dimethylallyltransferase MiaA, partial [Desulfuromonadaceae bacterium]|nr:tRNA (adenosine(37)-N6)-dimethylallyltransferase MiaA [Desulfuromonadaceae bacterium]
PQLNSLVLGMRREREELRQRITKRLRDRLENGMIEEVMTLHDRGIAWERLDYYGLEYRFIGAYLQGHMNKNDMFQKLNSAIHNFAKRQGNWFRRMESHGVIIHWIDGEGDILAQALEYIQKKSIVLI